VLSGDARALSGFSGALSFETDYRLAASENSRTELGMKLFSRAVLLSSQARAIAPDSENPDFANSTAELGLRHFRRLGDGVRRLELAAGAGWTAGDQTDRTLRSSVDYRQNSSEGWAWSFGGALQWQWDGQSGDFEDRQMLLRAALSRNLTNQDRLSFSLQISDTTSEIGNRANQTVQAQIGYQLAKPIGPARVSLSLGVQQTLYRDYFVAFLEVPGGRRDQRIFGSINLEFPTIDYAGFSPTIGVSAANMQSNISRFERQEINVTVGFVSTF